MTTHGPFTKDILLSHVAIAALPCSPDPTLTSNTSRHGSDPVYTEERDSAKKRTLLSIFFLPHELEENLFLFPPLRI